MTFTLQRDSVADFFDSEFEDELVVEIRLAELAIALSGCSARTAFHFVRRQGKETPLDRLARALAGARRVCAAA